MKIGIVGAGIGGLVAAVGFARASASVTVYERSPQVGPVGAGISLFGNGFRALEAVGLAGAVHALGSAGSGLPALLRTPSGRTLVATRATADLRVVHLADLHRILLDAAPPVHTGAAVLAVHPDGAVETVHGVDRFDLVVGADGIGSAIRRSWPTEPGIRYAGYVAWRGVPREPVALSAAGETWGSGERFGIAPLPDGRVYWFAVADAAARDSHAGAASGPGAGDALGDARDALGGAGADLAEVDRRFRGWHDPIPALLDATDPDAVLRNDIIELAAPLPSFVNGRIALVGDAAHAMTPNLGQGGNLAIEDAVTLARLFTDPSSGPAQLARYDAERRGRTATIARQSRMMGRVAQLDGLAVPVRNGLLRLIPGSAMARSAERLQAWRPPAVTGA
jgi:2-polyprenyl-6-methoxyphenol hydroxylase-like FAD-dependent oxidoreductase